LNLREQHLPLTPDEASQLNEVSAEAEWQFLEKFSLLECVFGNPEEIEAGQWIANKLRSLGMNVNVYDPELFISAPKKVEFEILDAVRYHAKHDDVTSNPKTSAFSKT
jgi:hypothetical protein